MGLDEDNSRLLTMQQLADRLACSERTVRRLVRRGLPLFRLGRGPRGQMRFDLGEVLAWLRPDPGFDIPPRRRGGVLPPAVFTKRRFVR
jgi:excisionase family DNA binding protein